ncbi:hypothetical protein F0562_017743 [Nyssa sinensis]|uniref:Uncharacterized protein n=1 Tax=Nyssa sinensis TaxID=561372 RepID=A0A5J4ZFZ8_9ASTE|nr:hypothetical protein F0562_017743 [Nyssa sinensis]
MEASATLAFLCWIMSIFYVFDTLAVQTLFWVIGHKSMPPHRTQIADDPISFQIDSSFYNYSITTDGLAITNPKEGNVEWSRIEIFVVLVIEICLYGFNVLEWLQDQRQQCSSSKERERGSGSGGGKKGKSIPGQKMITFFVEDSDCENRRVEELSTSVASLGYDVNLVSASRFGYSGLKTCG